jgi:hypothetical protein
MKGLKTSLILLFGVLCSLRAYNQDTLSLESKVQCLYAIYYESYKNGNLEPSMFEKAESMCYEILEDDSSNFIANYYLALMYGNEIVRLQEQGDLLSKKYALYRKRANRMIEEDKEKSEKE